MVQCFEKIITNEFWKSVLNAWVEISEAQPIQSKSNILSSPIRYNKKIAPYTLYYATWYRLGIRFVGDILDNNCNLMSI